MNKCFPLQHIVLYSKGWYKRYDKKGRGKNKSVFDDLRILLSLDDYSGDCFSDIDVATLLLCKLQEYFPNKRFTQLDYFATEVSMQNAWRYGYYFKECFWIKDKEGLPNYNYYEAIVYYCLSNISCLSKDELGDTSVKPIYSLEDVKSPYIDRVLPKPNRVSNKKLKEMFS